MLLLLLPLLAEAQPVDSTALDLSLDSLLSIPISSASKYEQAVSEAPACVTILTSDDIRKYGVTDLLEALQMVKSIYISNDRNYSYIGMRGFSRPTDFNNRVMLMIDGVPMNDNIWCAVNVRQDYFAINMDQVERIEVIRGASSALYGTAAMMGVINVVMKQGKSLDGFHGSVQAGSWGRLGANFSFGKRTTKGLEFTLGGRMGRTAGQRFYYPEFDTDSTLNGVADQLNDTKFVGLQGNLHFKGLSVQAMLSQSEAGVPTGSYETLFGDPRARVTDRQSFIDVSYTIELDKTKSLIFRDYLSNCLYFQYFPYAIDEGGNLREYTHGIWNTVEARLQWDVATNNRLIAGGTSGQNLLARFWVNDETGLSSDTNYPFQTYSFFVQDEYQPFRWMILNGGARFDRGYLAKQAITPRFSALLTPVQGTTVKLILGRAFRSPNISEMSVDDTFSDKGNPNLKPEFINTQEIVIEQRISKYFYSTASLFRYAMTDLVERVSNPADSFDTYGNIGNAVGVGAEADVVMRLENGKRFYSSISYTQVSSDNASWVTNSPRWIYKTGGSLNLLRVFSITGEFTAESPRLTVYGTQTPAFLLWNVNLGWHPKAKKSPFSKALAHSDWSLRINNLLNHNNLTPGGLEHLQPVLPQNGRNWLFSTRWSF
jgi:iron complex outermembrane receptor protein